MSGQSASTLLSGMWPLFGLRLRTGDAGEPVGAQGMGASDFAVTRAVDTRSWLVRPAQGRGLGKRMRAAILALAFEGPGAQEAFSGAFVDNSASAGVSRVLGYQEHGYDVVVRRGQREVERRFLLTRGRWEYAHHPPVERGLAPCMPLFGVQ